MTPAERELLLMMGTQLATMAAEADHQTESELFREAVDRIMEDERARPDPGGLYAELVQALKLRLAQRLEQLSQRPN